MLRTMFDVRLSVQKEREVLNGHWLCVEFFWLGRGVGGLWFKIKLYPKRQAGVPRPEKALNVLKEQIR